MVDNNEPKNDINYVHEPDKRDEKQIKRARRLIGRVKKQFAGNDIEMTEWEDEFLDSLDARLGKYGKAFCDPDLGAMNAPLSLRQGLKLIELKKKSVGKRTINNNPDTKADIKDNDGVTPAHDTEPPKQYSTFKKKYSSFTKKHSSFIQNKSATNISNSSGKNVTKFKIKKPLMRKSPVKNYKKD